MSDLDELKTSDDCVTLMTMHSAKGLEFNDVYLAGMEGREIARAICQ